MRGHSKVEGRHGKGKGWEKKRKERFGTEGTGENTPKINVWLRPRQYYQQYQYY